MDLTDNQQALVNLLADGAHDLHRCTGGFAVWHRGTKWSQGRTPNNAIAQADIDRLMQLGLLQDAGHGSAEPTYLLFASVRREKELRWHPEPEGYTGPAFTS